MKVSANRFLDNFQTFLEKLVEIFVGDKMIKNPFEAGKLRQWGLGGIQSGRENDLQTGKYGSTAKSFCFYISSLSTSVCRSELLDQDIETERGEN